jgi:hypothetical protein
MAKRTCSTVGGIVALGFLAFVVVPGCVITIGPGTDDGTNDGTEENPSGEIDSTTNEPTPSEQQMGEEIYAQLDPQELAIASTRAGLTTCALASTLDSLNLDPSTLDDAAIADLMEQYGPAIEEQAASWFSGIEQSNLTYTKMPKYECVQQYGCKHPATCQYKYIPPVDHLCLIDDCGKAKCRNCPDFVNDLLQNVVIKAWCSYVCVETGTSPPKVVAVGAGGISAFKGNFIGLLCIP